MIFLRGTYPAFMAPMAGNQSFSRMRLISAYERRFEACLARYSSARSLERVRTTPEFAGMGRIMTMPNISENVHALASSFL